MDLKADLPLAIVLSVLGLLTSLFSSLLTIFMIQTVALHYAILVILLLASIPCFVFAFLNNDSQRKKVLLVFVGVLCIFAGIVAATLSSNFHTRSSVANKASVYFIVVLALQCALTVWWSKLISSIPFLSAYSSGLEESEEMLIFVFTNAIVSFFTAFTISASNASSVKSIVNDSIVYTIGMWFLAIIANFAVGILISEKGSGFPKPAMDTNYESAPIKSDDYDKIG